MKPLRDLHSHCQSRTGHSISICFGIEPNLFSLNDVKKNIIQVDKINDQMNFSPENINFFKSLFHCRQGLRFTCK